jgi:hypothetical protein
MTTNKPESIETRLSVLTAKINQLTLNISNSNEQTDRRLNDLAEQAQRDRQQAAIDLQAWQAEIQKIREALLQKSGNGRQSV